MEKYKTKYGRFSDDGNEYIINTPKTPKPWINVISNGKYGLVVSQTGGGFSWDTHSEFNRLNRWHQDMILDNWGKYFYFKNNKTNSIWSPTWMPVKTELDAFECRYGFGYSRFTTSYQKINCNLKIFVPIDENFEIWNFEIENKSEENLSLSVYSYFEWCLGSSADHHREFHKTFLETDYHSEINCMTARKRLWEIPLGDRGHWNIEYPYQGFICCTNKVTDYDGDKESFIGQYASIEKPDGLYKKELGKKLGKWNDSIATLKTELNISSDEKKNFSFVIGIGKSKNEIRKAFQKYSDQKNVEYSLNAVKSFWQEKFNTLTVETPDDALNLLLNKWLRYQAIAGRLWARTGYYQQSGAYGFRDQLQDSLVFLPIDPKMTEEQIRLHARHQFEDGSVLHWWHPISETGLPTKMTDDLLWLPFVIIQYIDETNDYSLLKKKESYYDNKAKKDTLYNHCIAAIEKVLTRFSKRGLPLIGAGDWNDGLSAVGLDMKGESIWLAEFFYLILVRFSDICDNTNDKKNAIRYSKRAVELKKAFNKYAWDGEWYSRATKDNGQKIGSRKNSEGKIFLNPQTWAVISEIADENHQRKAMDAVSKYLLKNNGTLLLQPAYSKPDKMIGYLSRYAPGRRENGGVYTHAATWSIWAYAKLKKNDLAYNSYKRLCPIYNGMNPDKYVAEPFVTPGNIDGTDSPNYGMGGWTWYTGSASWFQRVVVEWILGIRPTKKGLLIDPCIPKEWKTFSVKRIFRGTTFNIKVFNESTNGGGVKKIKANGQFVDKNTVTGKKGETIDVEIFI